MSILIKYAGFSHPLQGGGENAFLNDSPFGLSSAPTHSQLALEIAPPVAPILTFEKVPDELSLGGVRYYILVQQGDRTWRYPLQFAEWEIPILEDYIWRWNWALSDEGYPVELGKLHRKMELLSDQVLIPSSVGGAS